MPTTGTIPLVLQIPGNLITANLWNTELQNIGNLMDPVGVGGYSATDTQMQIQTDPYPSNVTSHASNLGGELERIRFQISAILGATTPDFWYADPPTDLTTLANAILPVGGVIDYHSATPPTANWLLANGQAIGRSAFPALNALYSAASYPFGSGDGSTTFNLPNYTDRIGITAGNLYAVAATGGAVNQTLLSGQIPQVSASITDPGHTHTVSVTDPQHSHGITDGGHSHTERVGTGAGSTANSITGASGPSNSNGVSPQTTASATTGVTVNNASTGITAGANSNTTGISATVGSSSPTPVPTLPPYIGMYKMIRVL